MSTEGQVLLRDVMTRDVATVGPNEKLIVADDLMRLGRIRHLPVLDADGTLIGILTHRDLFHSALLRALGYGLHAKQQALEALSCKEAMHSEIVSAPPDMPLAAAAQLMMKHKIGCLPVLEGGSLVGILTEGDFVKLVAEGKARVAPSSAPNG